MTLGEFSHSSLMRHLSGALVSACLATTASAATITSVFVINDVPNGKVDFKLNYDVAPDYVTVDEFGRQKDEFQFYIDVDGIFPTPGSATTADTIVRGGEIYVEGDLRIRASAPSSGDPTSGGWGAVIAAVPFVLDGTMVTFSAAFAALGETDGAFTYSLLHVRFGGMSQPLITGRSVVAPSAIPLPAGMPLLAFGVASLLVLRARRRAAGD